MPVRLTAYVIAHGHLDIEWYQPMNSFRFWTVKALDRLLDEIGAQGWAPSYTLDGQVFPLEQYLKVRPEREAQAREAVERGILRIGPFYTQFDEWLPSGEGMVRNCLLGSRAVRRFGRPLKVGYLPDNFGHPLQLPQILGGFGIDTLLFMRGMPYIQPDFPDEFIYRGIDAWALRATHFRDGYSRIYGKNIENFAEDFIPQMRPTPYYEPYISFEHYLEMTRVDDPSVHALEMIAYAKRIAPHFPSGVLPVMVGCDHSPPHVGLAASIEAANALQSEIRFVSGDPEAYLAAARARAVPLPTVDRELLGTRFQYILLGSLSTRCFIKRQNFAAEALIERYAEPLDTLSRALGARANAEMLDEAWRLLMINHSHDSIHGSSTDEVHADMLSRYHQIRQTGAGVAHEALSFIGEHMPRFWAEGEEGLLFYRPEPDAQAQYAELWLPVGEEPWSAQDASGRPLATQVLPRDPLETNEFGRPTVLPFPCPALTRALVEVPGGDARLTAAKIVREPSETDNRFACGEDFIENEHVRLSARGALISLYDKASGCAYDGLCLLWEQAEAGDFFDSSETWLPSETICSGGATASVAVTERGPVRASMRIETSMNVPLRLENGLRSAQRVDVPIEITVSLLRGVRRADFRLSIDNRARDHKISLILPPIPGGRLRCQNAFMAFERPPEPPAPEAALAQPPTRIFPFREWLAVEDGARGLALAAKGLYDYERDADPQTGLERLRVTLLRGVGNMGRINIRAREGVAAFSVPAEGAQCLGPQSFEFAFLPFDGALSVRRADAFLYPPAAHFIRSAAKGSSARLEALDFQWDAPNVRFSAFKRAEDGEGCILRLYENEGRACETDLRVPLFGEGALCDLDESRLSALPVRDGVARLSFSPYQIRTLCLIPQKSE
jgi:alpha-mannosidase